MFEISPCYDLCIINIKLEIGSKIIKKGGYYADLRHSMNNLTAFFFFNILSFLLIRVFLSKIQVEVIYLPVGYFTDIIVSNFLLRLTLQMLGTNVDS